MLRNSYLEPYKTKRKKISEFEKEMLAHDENHLLNLERPLSTRDIGKLPNNILQTFIDDIMCNKKINQLLYSSNANKELLFYLKQKNFLLKNTNAYIKRNPFISPKNRRPCESVFLKKKKAAMFQIIKENISEFKNNKSHSMKVLTKKNNSFHKKQINMNEFLTKLFFKPVNDIRLEGYKKAVEKCLNKSEKKENFIFPDISFNINDVYSRLYHNAIKPVKLNEKKKENQEQSEKSTYYFNNKNISNTNIINKEINFDSSNNINNSNSNINNSKSLYYKKISKTKIGHSHRPHSSLFNKKNSNKNVINDYNTYYTNNKKKMPVFNLKKILDGSDGKEFSIKSNISIYQRCWSKNSGGPKIKKKFLKKIFNKILDENNSFSETNDIININSYRDEDNNSNLIISTKRNNVKFVQYFLNKKYDPNEKNKYGNTALHFAMKNDNKEIIKLLLDNGADISIKNKKGITPYDLASKDIKKLFKLDNIMLLKEPKKYYY